MDEPVKTYPPAVSRLSRTPSWVMLGFVLGAAFIWAWPRVEKTGTLATSLPVKTYQLDRPKLTEIEAVFAEWSGEAVWDNGLTEVALWDVDKKNYSICYEVLRSGGNHYFRSIPHLTRPVLTHGLRGTAPLLFTETEAMRREWLQRAQIEPSTLLAVPTIAKP